MAYTGGKAAVGIGLCAAAFGGTFLAMQARYKKRLATADVGQFEHTIANPPSPHKVESPLRSTGATVPSSDAGAYTSPAFDGAARSAAYSPATFDPSRPIKRGTDAGHDVRHPDVSQERMQQVPPPQRRGNVNPATGNVEAYTKKV